VSRYEPGDRVRVVSLTDLDAELDDPNRVITDNAVAAAVIGEGVVPRIGDVGTVVSTLCDYYDYEVRMDQKYGTPGNDIFAFPEADLEAAE
jgi:hypothetical protein